MRENAHAALTTSFAAAESVWPAGLEKEMNTFVEFRAAFDAKAGAPPGWRLR